MKKKKLSDDFNRKQVFKCHCQKLPHRNNTKLTVPPKNARILFFLKLGYNAFFFTLDCFRPVLTFNHFFVNLREWHTNAGDDILAPQLSRLHGAAVVDWCAGAHRVVLVVPICHTSRDVTRYVYGSRGVWGRGVWNALPWCRFQFWKIVYLNFLTFTHYYHYQLTRKLNKFWKFKLH